MSVMYAGVLAQSHYIDKTKQKKAGWVVGHSHDQSKIAGPVYAYRIIVAGELFILVCLGIIAEQ